MSSDNFGMDQARGTIVETLVLGKIFGVLFIILILFFIYGFLSEEFSQGLLKLLLGISLISLVIAINSYLKGLFFDLKLKQPKLKYSLEEVVLSPGEFNLADFLSFEVIRALSKTLKFAKSKRLF